MDTELLDDHPVRQHMTVKSLILPDERCYRGLSGFAGGRVILINFWFSA